MSWYSYRPYVSVAKRRASAAKTTAKLEKKGRILSPVKIEGRRIASTFWGKAWCENLESYSDFENRLPRGRTYARNGSVIDLQIEPGKITALIMGSSLYEATFSIVPLPAARWTAIKQECAGQIDSLVELLKGRFSDAVMSVITSPGKGLFPSPREMKKVCSCPDGADLCKHLAAVLYGIGARLDEKPELIFLLRGVDHSDLLDAAANAHATPAGEATLDGSDLAEIFGVEIAGEDVPTPQAQPAKPKRKQDKKAAPGKKTAQKKTPAKGSTVKTGKPARGKTKPRT